MNKTKQAMTTNSIDVTYNDVTDTIGEQIIDDVKTDFEERKGDTIRDDGKETSLNNKLESKNTDASDGVVKMLRKCKRQRKSKKRCGMPMGGTSLLPKTVDTRLQSLGIDSEKVSNCVKAAMSKGHIILTGEPSDLERLVIKGEYEEHKFKVFVKDILYQQDYAGIDYEWGSMEAPAVCVCCNAENTDCPTHVYVTRICTGKPCFNSGKRHNHCIVCKDFGECIGDYRNSHCYNCNNHYFAGLYGYPCNHCVIKGSSESELDDIEELENLMLLSNSESYFVGNGGSYCVLL